MTDEKILGGIQNGDESALEVLIDRYSKLLWVVACSVIGKTAEQDIEECVSDVFLALWRDPSKYDASRGTLKTYLALQAKSRALDYMRRKSRHKTDVISMEMIEQTVSEEMQPDDAILEAEDAKIVLAALEQLTEPMQTIVRLRYFFNLKPQDISLRLAIPKKEVDNKLYQGKKTLKRLLLNKDLEVSV